METAIVTGSTSNIGKAIAEGLSSDGYHVVVTSRHGDEASEVADGLENDATGIAVDFSEVEDIEGLFDHVDENLGQLSVIVNNVAYTAHEGILECDLDTWEYTMDTNLRSYFLCTKLAGERMKQGEGGNVVNMGVSHGSGRADKVGYTVSKGAVDYLTRCAARDLGPYGIRVNTIGSGIVGTPVGYDHQAGRDYESDRVPLGHIGEPEDIADAIRFLVSENAKYINGGLIPVDGGKEA